MKPLISLLLAAAILMPFIKVKNHEIERAAIMVEDESHASTTNTFISFGSDMAKDEDAIEPEETFIAKYQLPRIVVIE